MIKPIGNMIYSCQFIALWEYQVLSEICYGIYVFYVLMCHVWLSIFFLLFYVIGSSHHQLPCKKYHGVKKVLCAMFQFLKGDSCFPSRSLNQLFNCLREIFKMGRLFFGEVDNKFIWITKFKNVLLEPFMSNALRNSSSTYPEYSFSMFAIDLDEPSCHGCELRW